MAGTDKDTDMELRIHCLQMATNCGSEPIKMAQRMYDFVKNNQQGAQGQSRERLDAGMVSAPREIDTDTLLKWGRMIELALRDIKP